jgi:predicted neutral ceramidase superfamily lipid hydrolase
MKTARIMETEFEYRRPFLATAVRVLWNAVRLPIAAVLLALEPIVGFICGLGLVLGVLASILFEISAVGPRFPFLRSLCISLSFGVILFLYYAALSLFVED